MTQNDRATFAAPIDSPGGRRRVRGLAKLVAALGVVSVALALLGNTLCGLRDEWPSWTVAGARRPSETAPVDFVPSSKLLALLTRAGLNPGTGRSAPPLVFRDAEGTAGSLEQFRGKVVLVAFWGSTCIPCLKELPELEHLANRFDKTGLVVLPVCVDETNGNMAREVAKRHAPGLPIYVDPYGSVRKTYNLSALPQAVLIDREGRLLARSMGARRWAGKEVEQLLYACLGVPFPGSVDEDDAL
jgi:peroxiredoxin